MANDLLPNKLIKDLGAPTNGSEGAPLLTPAPRPNSQRAHGLVGGERAEMVEGPPAASMIAGFLKAVERIEKILEIETQMLEDNTPLVLHDLNHRKSHGLLELRRAMSACRSLDRSIFDAETKAPLARLRKKLERNLASLQTHLKAVSEIAAIITRAIQAHESDGTYSTSGCATDKRG